MTGSTIEWTIEWTPKAREILVAASRLFYAHGIHAVGVEAVATAAGVTKKTIYDRFGSKERLVVEYLRDRDARWRVVLDEQLAQAGGEPVARLRAVFDAAARWMADESTKGCGMINAHAEISDPAHPGYAVIRAQKDWMLDLFTAIVADSKDSKDTRDPRDPVGTARTVMLLHEGALVTGGIGVLPDAMAMAREAAVDLLATPADRG